MITGNCLNGRHHTCKGFGRHREKGKDKVDVYFCECDCHVINQP